MDEATARARIESMTAWDQVPVLQSTDIDALVAFARRADDSFRWVDDDTSWAASTVYAAGTIRAPLTRNGHVYTASAGTSGASQPTWPTTTGGTVVDGTVTWAESGGSWSPTYDLNAAAAEGWRWKAARVAGSFDFSTDQQDFSRSQMNAMCLEMAATYAKRITGSIRVKGSLPILTPPIIPIPADDSFTA